MHHPTSHHQRSGTSHWQPEQQSFAAIDGRQQPIYNPRVGSPRAPSNAYSDQLSYPAQHRESQFEGTPSNRMLLPPQTLHQGASNASQPAYMPSQEYYTSQHMQGLGHESMQHRPRTISTAHEPIEGHPLPVFGAPMGQSHYGLHRELQAERDTSEGRGNYNRENGPATANPPASELGRRGSYTSSSAHTPSRGETLREHHHPGL